MSGEFYERDYNRLEKLLALAVETIKAQGHELSCNIAKLPPNCNCGQMEEYKAKRTEFWRAYNRPIEDWKIDGTIYERTNTARNHGSAG